MSAKRIAVTGTPGTGKTTVTERLDDEYLIVHLNDVIQDAELYDDVDEDRGSVVANLSGARDWLDEYAEGDEPTLVESHLAHHMPADEVIVLRCHPEELATRLRDRGETEEKAVENAESEALDVILSESVANHGFERVYEVDTTDREPGAVADAIRAVVEGEREPSAGEVDYTEYLR